MPDDEIVVFAEPEITPYGYEYQIGVPAFGDGWVAIGRSKKKLIEALARRFRLLVEGKRADGTLKEWLAWRNLTWGYVRDFPGVKSRFRG